MKDNVPSKIHDSTERKYDSIGFLALSRARRIRDIFLFNTIAILGSTSFIGYLVTNVPWIGTTLKNFPQREVRRRR